MKRLIIILLFSTVTNTTFAQNKYDNNWVFGRINKSLHLNFDNDSLHITLIPGTELKSGEAHISMSDTAGNLIFYSNNCSIANAEYEIMENGAGLNPGEMQQYWCGVSPFLSPYSQSLIAIPTPGSNHLYDIYHEDIQYSYGGPGGSPKHLLRTRIDMTQDNGLGKVTEKNIPILEDTLASPKLTAVKHANGRDWWLIVPEYLSDCYYKVLLDPSGYHTEKQCLGLVWNKNDFGGNALFTPRGDKYIRVNDKNGLNIFDFDRCSGEFSNPVYISVAPDTNNICGLSVSGSGRFIYFNTPKKIYQFDLESPDIAASKILVAAYDGFVSQNTTDFYTSQRGPDGKIYICSYGPTYYLHTINHPDSAGLACEVLQHNILLPGTHWGSMPNLPNYRLGALPGACDTIVVSVKEVAEKDNGLQVYPNPGSGDLHISLDGNRKLKSVTLFDIAGRLIYHDNCSDSDFFLSREAYLPAKGFYLLVAEDQNGNKYLRKLIFDQ